MNELNINKKKRKKIFIYLSTLNKKSNKDTTRCTSPNVSEKSINQTLEVSLVSRHMNLPFPHSPPLINYIINLFQTRFLSIHSTNNSLSRVSNSQSKTSTPSKHVLGFPSTLRFTNSQSVYAIIGNN
jgi:hypothetical protein